VLCCGGLDQAAAPKPAPGPRPRVTG
jgi:hypothetical protein